MKEFRVLKGHKKEVCCKSPSLVHLFARSLAYVAVTWHPVHPLLVSGGSEGAILHWDLSSSTDTATLPSSQQPGPRATLSQAHDSNVWSLAFHPLGHLLVSASNDHTTRFWCRERPGDATSVFSGGGEKPPEILDMAGQDEEEDAMVPGFGYVAAGSGPGWWGKDEEADGPMQQSSSYENNNYARRGYQESGTDDFIPGFGASESGGSAAGRQSGPLPSQEDMFGGDTPHPQEEWRGGRGGRNSRWGGRRGRH